MVKTDLNERERQRYAKSFRAASDAARKCAEALDASEYEDEKFVIEFVLFSLLMMQITELQKIVGNAVKKDEIPEFPPIIGG